MESPEVDFEEVEVQEWVCQKQTLSQPEKSENVAPEKGDSPPGHIDVDSQPPPNTERNPANDMSEKQYTLVKIVHTKLFCPLHNTVGPPAIGPCDFD